jgi:hypothetical protein
MNVTVKRTGPLIPINQNLSSGVFGISPAAQDLRAGRGKRVQYKVYYVGERP